jgi:hypothetical protein
MFFILVYCIYGAGNCYFIVLGTFLLILFSNVYNDYLQFTMNLFLYSLPSRSAYLLAVCVQKLFFSLSCFRSPAISVLSLYDLIFCDVAILVVSTCPSRSNVQISCKGHLARKQEMESWLSLLYRTM